jgi:apolipoprotein N-acyltransferase
VGTFSALLSFLHRKTNVPFSILAPTIWVALELIRSLFLTGFPWGLLGYSQVKSLYIVQVADLVGVYGISFLIVFVNAGLTDLIVLNRDFITRQSRNLQIIYKISALVLAMSLVIGYGALRLKAQTFVHNDENRLSIGLVQGNIPQEIKSDIANSYNILEDYGLASLQITKESEKLIIWPETAYTATVFPGEGAAFFFLSEWAKQIGSNLLLGCPRYDLKKEGVFNSALLLSPTGDFEGVYDKIRLVPFGEYFPFEWVGKRLGNLGSFFSGKNYTIFEVQGNPFSVVICFEAIFPDLCRKFIKKGAQFLVNLTNDAWFGKTAAPYQHFDMACMRAVENRVWLVRVANTGISGFVDPYGRVIKKGGIFDKLILEEKIYKSPLKSLYARTGNFFAWTCLLFILFWSILGIKKIMKGESLNV